MLSYSNHFSITVALDSYRGNIYRLQRIFTDMSESGKDLGISFPVLKIEVRHWRTPSERSRNATAPIQLEGHLCHLSRVVRLLGYWLSPALTSTHLFRHRLGLAQGAYSFVKLWSSPGATVRPFLCHHLAQGLLLPIHTYGPYLFTPKSNALRGMHSFWHMVQRWTTNPFFLTPTSILFWEACLPHPIFSYCKYKKAPIHPRVPCAP